MKRKIEYDWYEEEMEILSKAMLKAREAFDHYLNDEMNLDGAYFKLDLKGYILSSDELHKMDSIEMKFDPLDESRDDVYD